MQRLFSELRAQKTEEDPGDLFAFFVYDFRLQTMKWLNGLISLKNLGRKPLKKHDIYQFVSVLLFSDLNEISLDKDLDALLRFDGVTSHADRMCFVTNHVITFFIRVTVTLLSMFFIFSTR